MKRYQRVPRFVDAIQFTGDNHREVLEFLGKSPMFDDWFASVDEWVDHVIKDGNHIKVFYENGDVCSVLKGDWVWREVTEAGDSPVVIQSDSVFQSYYTEMDDYQKAVLESLRRLAYLQSGGPCTGMQANQWLEEALKLINIHGMKAGVK